MTQETLKFSLAEFFSEILEKPSAMHERYTAFHNYSVCNQYLAALQLPQVEPIATYKQWQAMGRQVQKGAKAIALRMPVTVKDEASETEGATKSFFIFRRNWFGLSSTQGEEFTPPALPAWNEEKALETLAITKIPFQRINGNCMGFARPNLHQVSISPLVDDYYMTLFHELAHCLLHKSGGTHGEKDKPYHVDEFEAEATAYLVGGALGVGELFYSRGYLQHFLQGGKIVDVKEANMKRALAAADKILKAGTATKVAA
jgi:hypothetical protein